MKKMLFAAVLLWLTTASNCSTPYDRVLKKCEIKCQPNTVAGVNYNFKNNRYDKCVCNIERIEKELEE
jgi:hypothetical protein